MIEGGQLEAGTTVYNVDPYAPRSAEGLQPIPGRLVAFGSPFASPGWYTAKGFKAKAEIGFGYVTKVTGLGTVRDGPYDVAGDRIPRSGWVTARGTDVAVQQVADVATKLTETGALEDAELALELLQNIGQIPFDLPQAGADSIDGKSIQWAFFFTMAEAETIVDTLAIAKKRKWTIKGFNPNRSKDLWVTALIAATAIVGVGLVVGAVAGAAGAAGAAGSAGAAATASSTATLATTTAATTASVTAAAGASVGGLGAALSSAAGFVGTYGGAIGAAAGALGLSTGSKEGDAALGVLLNSGADVDWTDLLANAATAAGKSKLAEVIGKNPELAPYIELAAGASDNYLGTGFLGLGQTLFPNPVPPALQGGTGAVQGSAPVPMMVGGAPVPAWAPWAIGGVLVVLAVVALK